MPDEKEPVNIGIAKPSDGAELQIVSQEVDSSYSNVDLDGINESPVIDEEGGISESEALGADIQAMEAEMTEKEKKARTRRIQRQLAKDLGIPFKDLDGII